MFGKFSKKKSDEAKSESKSKQKNDLFTLLEDSSEKGSSSKNLHSDKISKNPNPETESETTKPDTKLETTKPDTKSKSIDKEYFKNQYIPESSIKGDKSQLLLLEIEKLPDKTIKPVIDFNQNSLFYPILSRVGQSPDDVSFLDDLTLDGTLIKSVFEKLILCPHHPEAFSSSIKLYCPKCNSLNVEKLNLYEHKRCGYIIENSQYDFSDPKNAVCPSCKRKIVDFKKEIRIPAMWHQCKDCSEKFDNAIIKMYCRQHEHDFDINSGQFITTYSYRLKDYDVPITSDDEKMHQDLEKLLNEFNFSSEFNTSVKGKSGNSHKVPIFAKNNSNGETITVFVHRNSEKVSQTDINSILIPILDIGPKHTLLLSTSEIEDGIEQISKQYGIEIISEPDLSRIISHVANFVSKKYSSKGGK